MIIRTMTPGDMDVVLGWAATEGWNPGAGDGRYFLATDPDGFFVAEEAGVVVGSISMPRFGPAYAFCGMYIVLPDYRGGTAGLRLARAASDYAEGRIVGTDGVLENVRAYERLGFEAVHSHHRHSGIPTPAEHAHIRPGGTVDIEALLAIDDACFPGERRDFMRAWLGAPHIVRASVDGDGMPTGFGVAREAADGWRIGPLYAPDAGRAAEIIRSLAAALPGVMLHVDVNTANTDAVVMARELGMVPGFECVRMYRGGIPELPTQQMFAVCTLEAG
jgi:predicted N-acetyltransferase YhbS